MGAYFITNRRDQLETVLTLMAQKGFQKHRAHTAGDVTILSFDKRFVTAYDNFFQRGDDFILGFGTYLYKGAVAKPALEKILTDVLKGAVPFSEVQGHFTLMLFNRGELTLVTDKTGIYHGYSARDGDAFYASSSLFAVAACLPRLTVVKQACLEFLYTQTTFGGDTIFDEISHLTAGTLYRGQDMTPSSAYYTPRDTAISVSDYLSACEAYLSGLESDSLSLSCDLSGGYDTRTVAALLELAGVDVTYNTNTNPVDKTDHRVGLALAKAVGKTCELFEHASDDIPFADRVDRALTELELCRDVFRSATTPRFFADKAGRFDIILGGYGGELLRDKYSRFKSLRNMLTAAYIVPGIRLKRSERDTYLDTLEAKFRARLDQLGETDIKKGVEKIYCLEKMRYWGGSRISAFNQYCYRLHPLLDDTLAQYAFHFSNEEKAGGALQRRIITAASPTMARVPSSYFGKPLVFEAGHPFHPAQAIAQTLNRVAGALGKGLRTLGNAKQVVVLRERLLGRASPTRSPSPLSLYPSTGRLEALLGIGVDGVFNNKIVGRYLTLEKTLARFEDKLRL